MCRVLIEFIILVDLLDELQEHVESIDMANGTLSLTWTLLFFFFFFFFPVLVSSI